MSERMSGRVVVVGSTNMDIIARVEHLPLPGETLLGRDAAFAPGGKGANQAVAARRLGADTVFYAAVGDDAFGRQMRGVLAAEGVEIEHLIEVGGSTTGIAMIEVAPSGENTIVVASGANFALGPADVSGLREALGPSDILLLQLEIPIETCLVAASAARAVGAQVVLNAAPPPKPDAEGLDALLGATDVLVVNETEALTLAERIAPAGPAGWLEIGADLRRRGPAAVVVTLGPQGAILHAASGGRAVPAFPVDAVDTTGAGDAFCGALATALADHADLATAVARGCAAGALATIALGAQSALPDRAAVDAMIASREATEHQGEER